ncbi:MAG: hypothetical protein ACXVAE_06375, partial [Candidatus Limnocylindrales bacterium]
MSLVAAPGAHRRLADRPVAMRDVERRLRPKLARRVELPRGSPIDHVHSGAIDLDGRSEVVASLSTAPFSIAWLPDRTLLIISGRERRSLRREPDGSLVAHVDLASDDEHPWNELVVDGRGNRVPQQHRIRVSRRRVCSRVRRPGPWRQCRR